ncbi:MAG: hypothetical protein WCX83_00235 [Candidatus Cloacimonas sp.]
MRIYTKEQLKGLSKQELQLKLDMVNGSIYLTDEEIIANRDMIQLALNNGVRYPIDEVMLDIKAGAADIDDMELR